MEKIKDKNIKDKTIKVLGINFSYYKKIVSKENFVVQIVKIEKVLRQCRIRNLIILGKIFNFQSLAKSEVRHHNLVRAVNKKKEIR